MLTHLGQTGAKALAVSNPANAVLNADNHEYFVENTPAQSLKLLNVGY